jgi:protein-S-isoprenylcysteine O-methyltransferase Ste14
MRPLPFLWPYALPFWLVFVWAFAPEFRIIMDARKRAAARGSQDRGSMAVIMAMNNLAMFVAFPLSVVRATRIAWPLASYILGIVLLIAGSVLRRHCFRVLGEYFTGNVQTRDDQPVVQRGAYRFVRHPSYSGGILMFTGIGFALGNWISVAALFVCSAIAYGYRVSVEEKALVQTIGQPYVDYMRRCKRFVPHVI